jgi:hypothetical protein
MILMRRFKGGLVESLKQLVPGVPLQEIAQLFVQPGPALLAQPTELLTKEFVDYYRSEGDTEQLQQLQAWRREGPGEPRLSGEGYAQLVRSARRAEKEQKPEAAQLFDEILQYPYHPGYYEAGMALARIHARAERHEEALRYTRLMRVRSPALAPAYVLEIQILKALGRPKLAKQVAEQARLFQLEHPLLGSTANRGGPGAAGARDPSSAPPGNT